MHKKLKREKGCAYFFLLLIRISIFVPTNRFMSTIGIEGMHFYAFHGVYAHEKETGAHYTVDVYIDYDFEKAGSSDKVEDTINYEQVFKIAEAKMNIPSNLIEKVCVDILHEIKSTFAEVKAVKARVTKHSPPIKGRVDKVFVEKTLS